MIRQKIITFYLKNVLMRKLFFLLIFQLLIAFPSFAQITIDGRTAYYDILTDTYLMSVPEDYEIENVPDSINLQFTHLPIIQLSGTFSTTYSDGTFTISLPSSETTTYLMKAKYRGGTTNTSSKHKRNFHIKFLDEDGNKYNTSLLGLRNDNSYLLDAGQVDLGRIRNHVAHEIWRDMGNAPYYADIKKDAKNYINAEFVEVFINNEYFGLYSLTENIDRKQMQIKKYDEDKNVIHGVLYKATSWTYTMMIGPFDEPDNNSDVWGGFELKYPEIDEICPTDWSPLYNALKFVDESDEDEFLYNVDNYFDIPILIDIFLYHTVLAAHDHSGKNLYWACYDAQDNSMLTPAIWDYDTTLGQTYNNADVHSSIYGPEADDFLSYANPKVIKRLINENVDNFVDKVLNRYWQLRQTVFSEDSLTARYNDYFDMLRASGTLDREEERWSGDTDIVGLKLDFDDEQAYIEDFILRHLIYLDEIFSTESGIQSLKNNFAMPSKQRYNIQGQKVDENYKGIVIIDGHKILVK